MAGSIYKEKKSTGYASRLEKVEASPPRGVVMGFPEPITVEA
jgi:hypothetical protein